MPRLLLKLFGPFRDYLPGGSAVDGEVRFTSAATIAALIRELGIPPEDPLVVMVNGAYCDPDFRLHDEDTVCIHPPIAGG